ncbi:unnamed protein product [Symbiodinium sp. CCMP2592]|nr:unnamed protein product [Symbiodinium sp. CCMP2592]
MTSEAIDESTDGFGQDTPAPPARKFHRARSSLRMDPEEAAGLELENRHLRRRVAELEHALEAKHDGSREGPESQGQSKPKSPQKLLQGLDSSGSEESDEEALRAEKRMKGIVVSGKWRKLAEGMKRLVREQDMDDIEAENEELKEHVLHLEERLKQVKLEAHRLQLQVQDDARVQSSYKDALVHAQQQVETAQMETDIQRRRAADLKEMLEQMELELSLVKLDTSPKPAKESVATPETAEDGPRVGRLSDSEDEADHLAVQLARGTNPGSPVFKEAVVRAVRLIRQNLMMQRKLSGLLEWRSEVTVSKLQMEIDQEVDLVQQLRARESKTGGMHSPAPDEAELEDLRLQCAELERQLQKDADSAQAEQARLRAELHAQFEEVHLHEDESASHVNEVQALEMSLAEAWRAVRQESQDARDAQSASSGTELQQMLLAEEQRCQELESACESMSMAVAEAGETASRLHKAETELSQQCQTLKEEKAELLLMTAARSSEEGITPDTESSEESRKVRALEQENETLRLKCTEAEEQGCREEATTRREEVEEWQTRCSALEADARKAARLQEELQLKAEELTSSLTDLEVTRKGQVMAQELAESLDKSYKELKSEYSNCHAELSEAKMEAERLRQLQPAQPAQPVQPVQPQPTAPRASLVATQAGEPATLGSTVAALRRARASLAGEAIERVPQVPQQAQADPGPGGSPPARDVSAGLKALQRLKAAAAGKAKVEAGAGAESPQSKAASLIANRSKASSLWLKAAQTTSDAAKE